MCNGPTSGVPSNHIQLPPFFFSIHGICLSIILKPSTWVDCERKGLMGGPHTKKCTFRCHKSKCKLAQLYLNNARRSRSYSISFNVMNMLIPH